MYDLNQMYKDARNIILRVPDIGIVWTRLKHLARVDVDAKGGVACVSENGTVTVHPNGFGERPSPEREFILAHEFMHYLLIHNGRVFDLRWDNQPILRRAAEQGMVEVVNETALKTWGVATDIVINETLAKAGLQIPSDACTKALIPPGYSGAFAAEPLWKYMMQKQQGGGGGGGGGAPQPAPGRGCAPDGTEPQTKGEAGGDDGDSDRKGKAKQDQGEGGGAQSDSKSGGSALDGIQLKPQQEARDQILALGEGGSNGGGIGTQSAIADCILATRARSLGWADVLRKGMLSAAASGAAATPTWSKLKRKTWRMGDDGVNGRVAYAGRNPSAPKVAVVIDVSGSMDRAELSKVITHTLDVMKVTNTQVFLVTHSVEAHWAGWVKPGDKATIEKATVFTGGTAFDDAYAKVKAAGKFDHLIHFTDSIVGGWPTVPAKDLTIGLMCGVKELYCKPPRSRFNLMHITDRS
ncbi:coil containing protein [Caudoviricetes sp.]|nr:coil containing protein [Caudoviricetes sp.]